jgi:ABC-type polysaccharide/polyol phosphate transport system ATPase subunit
LKRETVIEAKNLTKKYKIYGKPADRLVEWFTLGSLTKHKEFCAVNNVTFEINKGECLGIIGSNGAGKSTILKLISGVITPTSGSFYVNGRVVSLLELGTGFNPELNGIDNIYNSARLLGLEQTFIQNKIQEILAFSELGEFVYQPIKTYSSGMIVRLAFSLFACIEPDVFIVDEALSVGDMLFQQKCFKRINEMIRNGATLIFVSHDFDAIRKLCSKVIVLKNGEIYFSGEPVKAIHHYTSLNKEKLLHSIEGLNQLSSAENKTNSDKDFTQFLENAYNRPANSDFCDKDVEILGVQVTDLKGQPTSYFNWEQDMLVKTLMRVHKNQSLLSNGILIFDRMGQLVWGSGTINLGDNLGPCEEGSLILTELKVRLKLHPGKYSITVGVSSPDLTKNANTGIVHDRFEQLCVIEISQFNLEVNEPVPFFGLIPLECELHRYSIKDD